MAILGNFPETLNNKRLLASLRGDFPFLFVVPGLLCGQLVSTWLCLYSFRGLSWLFVALGALSLWRNVRIPFFLFVAGFVPGIVSVYLNLPSAPAWEPQSGHSYVAVIDEVPRRRAPGAVELSLQIEVAVSGSDADSPVTSPAPPVRALCRAIELPWKNISEAREGDRLVVRADFHPVPARFNPFAYESTLRRHGYEFQCRILYASSPLERDMPLINSLRESVYSRIIRVLGDNEDSGFFLSMAFGVRDVISKRTEEAFKKTGMTHLLVFSGYQVVLVYQSILLIFRFALYLTQRWLDRWWLLLSARAPLSQVFSLLALGASLGIVWLCGIEGSSLRAAVAIVIVVASGIVERGGGMLNSILLSLTLLSLVWPGCWLEPGVELTFGALLGICCGAGNRTIKKKLWTYLRVCLYASLCTSAIVLAWFDMISLIGFLINPVMAPLGSILACNFGYTAVVIMILGIDPAGYLLQLSAWLLEWVRMGTVYLAQIPGLCFEPEGLCRWCLIGIIVGLVLKGVGSNFREYVLINGLGSVGCKRRAFPEEVQLFS